MRRCLPLLLLPLAACQSGPPVEAGDISQYYCPNGSLVRMSLDADRGSMRLSIGGRSSTLRRDERSGHWSNGRMTAELDGELLRLDTAGSLLRQNCRLQIPASNAGAATAPQATVSGSISYRQRIALSPRATVHIVLEDVSLMDVAAIPMAETTLENPGQVPIPFSLSYDASRLQEGHRYSLRVRIEEDGRLLFINTSAIPLPAGNSPLEIWLDAAVH